MKKIISFFLAIVLACAMTTSSLATQSDGFLPEADFGSTDEFSTGLADGEHDTGLIFNDETVEDGDSAVLAGEGDVDTVSMGQEGGIADDGLFDTVLSEENAVSPAQGIARAAASSYISDGLYVPVGGGNGSASSPAWTYVNASRNGLYVYRNAETFASEYKSYSTYKPVLFGEVINIKPGSYSISMGEAYYLGNANDGTQKFDATRSRPKQWDFTNIRGDCRVTTSEFDYMADSSFGPYQWDYVNIENAELGDVIGIKMWKSADSMYWPIGYLVVGPRLSGSLEIYDGETNVSQQALSVKISSNGDSSLDLSGHTSIAGERYEPGDAEVTWSSSNKDIAAVSSSGVVTPKKVGTVTITASWPDKYFKCSNTVTVNVEVNQPPVITDVTVDPPSGVATVTATDDRDTDVLKYGYSDSSDDMPSTWQDSNEFKGLLGRKWFWAKDTEEAVSAPYEKFVYGNADIVESELVGLKTEYFVGDKIDVDGAYLVLKFSNGDTQEIPVTEDMLSDYDNMTPGPEDITVTYGDIVKPATVNFHPLDFSVEFPDEITIRINEDGTPVVEGEYSINNNSSFAIKVTGIQVIGKGGWNIFNPREIPMEDNTKALIFTINGCPTGEAGSIDTSNASWIIAANKSLPLHISVQVPNQTSLEPGVIYKVATVEWTADWSK